MTLKEENEVNMRQPHDSMVKGPMLVSSCMAVSGDTFYKCQFANAYCTKHHYFHIRIVLVLSVWTVLIGRDMHN